MPITTSGSSNDLSIKLVAYRNSDDVLLLWRTQAQQSWDSPLPGCRGFMIERQRRDPSGQWSPVEILRNRVGFTVAAPDPEGEMSIEDTSQPSDIWPFQRYDWTDHGANDGDVVRYRVSAVRLPEGSGKLGEAKLKAFADSGWTDAISITGDASDGMFAYFNRGFVMSQYIARLARKNQWKPRDIKNHVRELEEPMRRFLSGDLRVQLLALLDEVIDDPALSLYAALYELGDAELIDRLEKLRGRAHVVLSNGSDKSGDGNEASRAMLTGAGVDVHDRLLGSKGLGHNKFAVVVGKDGAARKAWTGSTNWSASGLCTQVNNGILFDDPQVAALFRDQWERLADAGDEFPATLVSANAESPRTAGKTDVWFTRIRSKSTRNTGVGKDLEQLVSIVNGAKQAILYVMFQPGTEPLQSILNRMQSGLYVRGVVSTVTSAVQEKFQLAGIDTGSKEYQTDLIQPEGVGKDFGAWLKEVVRSQFIYPPKSPGIGHAITHAKMFVVDPFSNDCAVVTGSHNFSAAASEGNDENFVVVRGNRQLAEAYSVACYATYNHYRWRAYLKEMFDAGKTPWSHLDGDDGWQARHLSPREKSHLRLWCA